MSDESEHMTEERLLIERAQKGDKNAFCELVEKSKENVFRLAYDLTGNRHDAEDVSQEVFIKAFRALKKFRFEAKFSSWLYRITVNTCHDFFSKNSKNKVGFYETEMTENLVNKNNPAPFDRLAELSIMTEHIEHAIHQLTTPERSVFILRQYYDLQLKQIADILKVKEGTVKTLLFRSIRKLQQKLNFYKSEIRFEGKKDEM